MSAAASRHDLSRFGSEVMRFSPRQCDLMIVAGRVAMKMLPVLQRIWLQMPEPKWCISMGACACSGGVFDTYAVVQGIDRFMPVDVYVPGCPPRPEQLIKAIVDLQELIKSGGTYNAREFALRDTMGGPARFDEDELIRYAWRVAGTVGLMMCNVLDVHDPRAAPFAVDLGIAMQLTNIARDVGEDARMGRRYLPTSWIGAVEPVAIAAPDLALQRSLEGATKRLLALADRYYASGEAGLGFLPLRARFGIFSAARMYRAIGGRIAADGHRSWAQRAVIGSAGKVGHASLAAALMAIQPRLHRRDAAHDPSLQDALVRIDGAHE
jgi:NADH-quinone oxidoreductase subunit B